MVPSPQSTVYAPPVPPVGMVIDSPGVVVRQVVTKGSTSTWDSEGTGTATRTKINAVRMQRQPTLLNKDGKTTALCVSQDI